MRNLKAGDLVAVYGGSYNMGTCLRVDRAVGIVTQSLACGEVNVHIKGSTYLFHRKQVRKLTRKPRVEKWVNIYNDETCYYYHSEQEAKNAFSGLHPGRTVHLREVLKK